jgi:hypothetical protein
MMNAYLGKRSPSPSASASSTSWHSLILLSLFLTSIRFRNLLQQMPQHAAKRSDTLGKMHHCACGDIIRPKIHRLSLLPRNQREPGDSKEVKELFVGHWSGWGGGGVYVCPRCRGTWADGDFSCYGMEERVGRMRREEKTGMERKGKDEKTDAEFNKDDEERGERGGGGGGDGVQG